MEITDIKIVFPKPPVEIIQSLSSNFHSTIVKETRIRSDHPNEYDSLTWLPREDIDSADFLTLQPREWFHDIFIDIFLKSNFPFL